MMVRVHAPLLAVVAAIAAVFGTASGASYTVGEPGGSWDIRTNFTAWASSIDFHPGDQLVFKYPASAHDVVEVSRSGYRSCSANPVSMPRTGSNTVLLAAVGRRYFICGVPGHCDAGMKLQVRVVPAGCNSPSPSPPSAEATNGSPGWNGTPGGLCLGDSPTTIITTPGVISYGSAPGSSGTVSSALAIMLLLLGLMF
ncbi:chemocyanin-like [Phragmites australis]|uniref:chemocyanin-like n=1 Tax=Phragmites australis TaxID=29695 RepID=UPI002D76DA32|nr:chemocyanin-like [Phragmites australis]